MNCIDLTSKQSKMLSYVVKHSKLRKTTKEIKLQWIASIWHQNDLKCWDTLQNYKSDHITMNLHRFDVKTITTTLNYKRDQITMNLHQFDIKTIKNVESRHKTFKTTQNYKTDQITMICIDLMWKRSKNPKLKKQSNNEQFASIWHQNDQKWWGTSQNIQNNTKLQNWSNCNELHRFDIKTI